MAFCIPVFKYFFTALRYSAGGIGKHDIGFVVFQPNRQLYELITYVFLMSATYWIVITKCLIAAKILRQMTMFIQVVFSSMSKLFR
tara:strand:- start:862 stop:1119 length:258 start_codon:yes stop_codon:yes gene_type:complete